MELEGESDTWQFLQRRACVWLVVAPKLAHVWVQRMQEGEWVGGGGLKAQETSETGSYCFFRAKPTAANCLHHFTLQKEVQ